MDQIRPILVWLKQHHFWVLCGVVAVIALGCWWSASGALSAQYAANEQQITAGFTSLTNLRNDPFHPNEDINEKQDAETRKQAEAVMAIWDQLYERQREHVLEWPAALSQAFRDHVEKLGFGDKIPPHLRQNYQDYVEQHFPSLPKKIGARVMREDEMNRFGGGEFMRGGRGAYRGEGAGLGMTPDGFAEDEEDYIVEWLDQGNVRDELNFPQRPSAMRIWVTQENLWVYHTLLDVIRNTNEAAGATRRSNAAVRTIFSLEVGRPAAQYSRTTDRIVKLATAEPAAMPGSEFDPSMMGGEMPAGRMPMENLNFSEGRMMEGPGGAPMSDEQEAAMLLTHRYLDQEGKPIPVGGAGGDPAMAADPYADPSASLPVGPIDPSMFGTEYKRLPVRMVLEMDQRWLPHLISECASQALQVEVQEVRVNVPDAGGTGGGFGGGFRGGYEGRGAAGGMGGSMFPDRTGVQTFSQQPNIVNVVIQGVVYIFNKPDESLLPTSEESLISANEY